MLMQFQKLGKYCNITEMNICIVASCKRGKEFSPVGYADYQSIVPKNRVLHAKMRRRFVFVTERVEFKPRFPLCITSV